MHCQRIARYGSPVFNLHWALLAIQLYYIDQMCAMPRHITLLESDGQHVITCVSLISIGLLCASTWSINLVRICKPRVKYCSLSHGYCDCHFDLKHTHTKRCIFSINHTSLYTFFLLNINTCNSRIESGYWYELTRQLYETATLRDTCIVIIEM